MKQCHLKKLKRVKDIDGNLLSSVRVGRIGRKQDRSSGCGWEGYPYFPGGKGAYDL